MLCAFFLKAMVMHFKHLSLVLQQCSVTATELWDSGPGFFFAEAKATPN